MQTMQMEAAEFVSGGLGWDTVVSYLLGQAATHAFSAIASGKVDYAGMAEQQGHSYNMMGA